LYHHVFLLAIKSSGWRKPAVVQVEKKVLLCCIYNATSVVFLASKCVFLASGVEIGMQMSP
jgi:hypothetical protein